MPKKYWSEDVDRNVKFLYDDGIINEKDIAEELNLDIKTVCDVLWTYPRYVIDEGYRLGDILRKKYFGI